jgi:hypothetical protein
MQNMKETDYLEDIDLNGRVLLEINFKKALNFLKYGHLARNRNLSS